MKNGREQIIHMTYEEIVEELQRVIEREQDKEYDTDTFNLNTMAKDCLRFIQKQHNPPLDENGLARCGCGGKPKFRFGMDWKGRPDDSCFVICEECGEQSGTVCGKEIAQHFWNRARGIKEENI